MQQPIATWSLVVSWAINTITDTSTQLSPDHAEQMARLIWGGQ